jgi:hypothetical protein
MRCMSIVPNVIPWPNVRPKSLRQRGSIWSETAIELGALPKSIKALGGENASLGDLADKPVERKPRHWDGAISYWDGVTPTPLRSARRDSDRNHDHD